MTSDEIKAIQRELCAAGYYAGEIDGRFGTLSRTAAQRFLKSLCPDNPWPRDNTAALIGFFGQPGDESRLVSFDFPYPMLYDGKRVTKSRCHKKVKESLVRVLTNIKQFLGDPNIADEAQDYGGIFNNRPMRGGSSPSRHSWGMAIDLDADDNTLHLSWPHGADMNWEIIKAFAREGWTSAAVWWARDAMHFQATRP